MQTLNILQTLAPHFRLETDDDKNIALSYWFMWFSDIFLIYDKYHGHVLKFYFLQSLL